jgi:hypothetical protein
MGGSLGVSRFASLAGDLALLVGVHSSKATVALFWHNRLPYLRDVPRSRPAITRSLRPGRMIHSSANAMPEARVLPIGRV